MSIIDVIWNEKMQKLDVTKTEAAWSSLAGKVYVPHSEEEYGQLVALLDSFIDEVGEDESHPLASLMEIVGVLIEKYEDEQVPELSDALRADAMSNNYAQAAERARQFFVSLSVESDALNAKINEYSDRLVRITKRGNPVEFEAIINGSASDLELYVQRIEALLPDFLRELEVTAEGADQSARSADPSTSTGAKVLDGFLRAAEKLLETAGEAKLRSPFCGTSLNRYVQG